MKKTRSWESLLKQNDQLTVDWQVSTAKPKKGQIPPALRILKEAERTQLENDFLGLWRMMGGDPDFWVKAYIPGHGHPFEEELELDFFNERAAVAVEVQGGQYLAKSGHSNPAGLARDARKIFRCQEMGIRLFHFPKDLVDAYWVEALLAFVKWKAAEVQ